MKKKLLAILLTAAMTLEIFGTGVFASAEVSDETGEEDAGEIEEDLNALDAGGLLLGDITEELLIADEDASEENGEELYVGYEGEDESEGLFSVEEIPEDGSSEGIEGEVPDDAAENAEDTKEGSDDAAKQEEAGKDEADKEAAAQDIVLEEAVDAEEADAETVWPEVPVYYAEDIEDAIENAESLGNEAFFEIDPEEGIASAGDMLFEELSEGDEIEEAVGSAASAEEKTQIIEDALEETGLYTVEKKDDGNLEVTSIFSTGRLMLEADYQPTIQSYGAVNALYYDGSYEFTYENEEATKNAYEMLVNEYGEDAVIRDMPVKTRAAQGWGTSHMKMDVRMRRSSANYTVKVAVIDTGVNTYHSVFNNTQIVNGYCIPEKSYDYYDVNGHGTAVAGIIAESTGSNVQIMPIRVATDSSGQASGLDILKGAQYASKHGAKVINISMGGPESESEYNYFSKRYAKINRVIVCASGNEDHNMNYYLDGPAVYPSTIAVGSIDSSRWVSSFSNYGGSLDYVAPGESVMCASRYGGWTSMSGTSMASPYIAAAVGLLYSDNKNLTPAEVRKVLKEMCVDLGTEGRDILYGWGLPVFSTGSINVRKCKVNNISNRVYSGKLIKPCPRVTYNGVKLTRGVDYTLNWSNNKLAGTGIVVIVGKGRYTGVTRKAFNIILKGKYTIRSAVNTNYTLDVKGGSKNNKANIQLYRLNNSAAQKFNITKVGKYYKIINCKSGKALEVKGGIARNGRNIQQYKWNRSKAQLWKVKMYSGGKIMFVSAVNGKYCLDLAGAKAKNMANVQLYKRNNSKAQRWYVKRAK